MSDDATPRLSLPYLAAGQAQKHVTLNESLALLDGLVQTAVESRATSAQPATSTDGALYILPAGATGADWSGKAAGTAMRYEAGAWAELPVGEGCLAYVKDEDVAVFFDGSAWNNIGLAIDELQNLSLLGVNTTADATNKLAVASDAVLFTHAGAGSQVKVNKNAAGDTASHLFQTGYSGRAEFGLTGSDDFTLKVSADGSSWHDVLSVARATGKATFALSPVRSQTDVFTSSGTYNVPAWATRLRITCVGGGGGGACGAAGTNAATRSGGAGGGAGGRSAMEYDVADLAASLTVTIGAGGTGTAGVTGTASSVAGGGGGDTTVSSAGSVILLGGGGSGGLAGGNGGTGGTGNTISNAGGVQAGGSTSVGGETTRTDAPGGGGGGAQLVTAGTAANGGRGGDGYYMGSTGHRGVRGSAGTGAGGAGGAGSAKAWTLGCGGGGGGGANSTTTNGGAGGAGGAPGGGGGGGGATRDTFTSGAGGAGGRGEVWIEAIG